MTFRLNMSAGEFFELIRPAVLIVSAIVSAFVLASARKRFPFYQSLLWAIGILFAPLIVLPLYWFALLTRRRTPETTTSLEHRFAVPLSYAVITLLSVAAYLYSDYRSVDGHLARAAQAKVRGDKARVIREYRQALALEDNPHTHKLLGIELAAAGYGTDAISEFRLAEQGGEPDDSIHFRLGLLLEKRNREGEANLEFQKFLTSGSCTRQPVDEGCEVAQKKINVSAATKIQSSN